MPETMVFGEPGRKRSLRREWSRAFTIMLLLLLTAAVATVVGLRSVVSEIQDTASGLHRESVTVAALTESLVEHEQVAHKLLSEQQVDRATFLAQQHTISGRFATAIAVFPRQHGMKATVVKAAKLWQDGLRQYGLWSGQALAMHGDHSADNPTFGAASDSVHALLDGLGGPSLAAMDQGLAHGAAMERLLIALLVALFGIAVGVTVYFRRRMVRDLLRPVATMHHGVSRLHSGEYEHRMAVARRDELGELAEAFNAMVLALHDSHVALTRRATHDSLTGLPNRVSLVERLSASFVADSTARMRRESVLFIDVDDFKEVNDTLGHEGGDVLLIQLAGRLNDCVHTHDLVTRLGGDEFAIVVVDEDGRTASQVAERILSALREPFIVNGVRLTVSVSIGIAPRRPETCDPAELLRSADFAMYMAKGGGKDRYQTFDTQAHGTMAARSALKRDLAVATTAGQLRLDYQPVVDLRTGEVLGVEALVRWEHPTLGLLAPADFIDIAEETGDIAALGHWVLDTATRQAAQWRRTMPQCAELWVSINLSPFQLPSLAHIRDILIDPAAQANLVVLEVTETALATNLDGGIAALTALAELGVRIAIDDFGRGFSSLSTLASLPVDILKIDQYFVSGRPAAESAPMLEAILGLASRLSLTVIAEGIEQPDQLDLLRDLGCTLGQGFLLARPLSAHEMRNLLTSDGLLPITQTVS